MISHNENCWLFEQERERFLAVGSDLQVIARADGYFHWVSPSFERLLGWTVEEMTSRPWTDFVHPDDVNTSVSEADSLFCGSKTLAFENRYRHKDGSYRWLLWKTQLYSKEQVLYGAAVDITECKQVEQALRQSEEQSRNILESIDDGFFALNQHWQFTYINQSAEALLARTSGELIGKDFWQEFPGLSGSEFEQMHRGVMRDRVARSLTAFYPDHERWYEFHTYPAANGITIYFRNITEKIQAEAALRASEAALRGSEERFRLMVESAKEYAIFTLDLNGSITSWNAGAERLLGYQEAEIIGCDSHILYTSEDNERGRADWEMQTARTQGQAVNECWHMRKDGSRFWGLVA